MIRYLTHADGRFWSATAQDDLVLVRSGEIGTEGELDVIDTWESMNTPPAYALDDLAMPMVEKGYHFAPIPDIVDVIEAAHGVTLPEPVRTFFAAGTYWRYQDARCDGLECTVDFATDAVLGNYHQVHWDDEREAEREFVPISGRLYDGIPDEQQWIGIDPEEERPAVYALYTSGAFELAYESFDAFLANLAVED